MYRSKSFTLKIDIQEYPPEQNKFRYAEYNKLLIKAATLGSSSLVKNMLEKKADVNYKESGFTALHHAIQNQHYHLIYDLAFDGFDFSQASIQKLLDNIYERDEDAAEDNEIIFFLLNELIDLDKIKPIDDLLITLNDFYAFPLYLRLNPKQTASDIALPNKLISHLNQKEYVEYFSERKKQLNEPTYLLKANAEWTKLSCLDGRDLNTHKQLKALCERKENQLEGIHLKTALFYMNILTHIETTLAPDRGYIYSTIIPYLVLFFPTVLAKIISEYCESLVNEKWRFFSYSSSEEDYDINEDIPTVAKEMLVLKQAPHETSAVEALKDYIQIIADNEYSFIIYRLDNQLIIECDWFAYGLAPGRAKLEKLLQLFKQALASKGIEEKQYKAEVAFEGYICKDGLMKLTITAKSSLNQKHILDNIAELLESIGYLKNHNEYISYFLEAPSKIKTTLFSVTPKNEKYESDHLNASITCKIQ